MELVCIMELRIQTLGKQYFNYSINDLKEIIKISEKIKFSELENKYYLKVYKIYK